MPPAAVVTRLRAAGCVFAEDEAALLAAAASGAALDTLVERRACGEPLEHVLGWVGFDGLRLAVGPGAFVPRQRTTLMARLAVRHAGSMPAPVVVELCCGVAPVASVVAAHLPRATVFASDIDAAAVTYAQRNLGDRGVATAGDLDGALPAAMRHAVDVLAVNTPYVPSAELAGLPREARDHEPRQALDGGTDGLDVQRRLAGRVRRWLRPGGIVLVETSAGQAAAAAALFAAAGLHAVVERDEGAGATIVCGRMSGPFGR